MLDQVAEKMKLLLPSNQGVMVAVSGGADSVAFLLSLNEIGVRPLVVAHVNHGLRGPESDGDQAFVEQIAASLGLPCEVQRVMANRSDEATLRRLRYRSLFAMARRQNLNVIATGHTADDQAETVLHRFLRGSGLDGLAGIGPRIKRHGHTIIRPMLAVRRAEVLDFLAERGQSFRTDSSNADPRYTRNRLRAEWLPRLGQEYNPRLVEHLCHLAILAQDHRRADSRRTLKALTHCELPRAGAICVFDLVKLQRLSPQRLRELWRRVWRRERWPMGALNYSAWDRLAALVRGGAPAVDCPAGIRARRLERVVRVGPGA